VGAVGRAVGGWSKCQRFFGCQTCKNNAVTANAMIPLPMSVIGNSTTPISKWAMAKQYWVTANVPPATTNTGITSSVCRQVHIVLTM
jgi:hypothetical protein